MKYCTDLEQSKKLAKILSTQSADKQYILNIFKEEEEYKLIDIDESKKVDEDDYPAWTLSALLDVFPCCRDDDAPTFELTRGGWIPSYTNSWFASYANFEAYSREPLDAVVNLIYKLNKYGIILK